MGEVKGATGISSKEKLILASIVLGTFMASLDATIVAVALPTIASEFSISGSTGDVSWILLGYTLALCCLILLWGKIGSNVGYKKLFITGVLIFTVMSGLIGLTETLSLGGLNGMILMRVVQGVGAGMVTSMGLAMVSTYLPQSKGTAIGIITLAASAGTAFGPVLGGVLCYFDWTYIFFINVPIGLFCILLSMKSMADVKEVREQKQKLDIVGVVMMVIMMFTAIYYLNTARDIGWTSDTGLLLITVAMVFAGLLIWWERRNANPLISVRLMGLKDLVMGNITCLLIFSAMAGSYLLLPYYLECVLGYSTVEMGLILVANSLGMMVVGTTVGRISDRTGINNRMVSAGCLIAALGFFIMTRFDAETSLILILSALFVMGMGVGITLVAGTNLCMGYAKEGENGVMSGLINTFRQAGSTAGVAILESVFAASIVIPSIMPDNLDWLMSGFRPAFFIAVMICLLAFIVSTFVRDKKTRDGAPIDQ